MLLLCIVDLVSLHYYCLHCFTLSTLEVIVLFFQARRASFLPSRHAYFFPSHGVSYSWIVSLCVVSTETDMNAREKRFFKSWCCARCVCVSVGFLFLVAPPPRVRVSHSLPHHHYSSAISRDRLVCHPTMNGYPWTNVLPWNPKSFASA